MCVYMKKKTNVDIRKSSLYVRSSHISTCFIWINKNLREGHFNLFLSKYHKASQK